VIAAARALDPRPPRRSATLRLMPTEHVPVLERELVVALVLVPSVLLLLVAALVAHSGALLGTR